MADDGRLSLAVVNGRLDLSFQELKQLPAQLTTLQQLTALNIHSNLLTSIPSLANLSSLTEVTFGDNRINTFPPSLSLLPQLKFISAGNNQIQLIPSEIGQLRFLDKLYLYENKITQLPKEVYQLRRLRELHLEGNQLSIIPAAVTGLVALTALNVAHNILVTIDPALGFVTTLQSLNLHHNRLVDIPRSLAQLTALTELELSDNPLRVQLQELYKDGAYTLLAYMRAQLPEQSQVPIAKLWPQLRRSAKSDSLLLSAQSAAAKPTTPRQSQVATPTSVLGRIRSGSMQGKPPPAGAGKYLLTGTLEFTEPLEDGWIDMGRSAQQLRSVDDLRQEPLRAGTREVILLDKSCDAALAALLDGPIAAVRTLKDMRARVVLIALLIQRMLPLGSPTALQESIESARTRVQSNVLPVLVMDCGACRHRCALFKYLADRVNVPCRLVCGITTCEADDADNGSHTCCIVRVNQRTYLMDLITTVSGAEIPLWSAALHQRLERIEGDVLAVVGAQGGQDNLPLPDDVADALPRDMVPGAGPPGANLILSADTVQVGEKFAGGPLGSLHYGDWSGIPVVVRCIPTARVSALDVLCDLMLEDAVAVSFARHPRLLPMLGLISDPPSFVQPLVLNAKALAPQSGSKCVSVLCDIASALLHLHTRRPPLIHGALRPGAVLLDERLNAFVCDFSLRRTRAAAGQDLRAMRWKAPECARGERPSPASDVWTFGLLVLYTSCGLQPYAAIPDADSQKLMRMVSSGASPAMPSHVPAALQSLASKCLKADAEQRITMAEVLQMLQRK